MCGKLRIRAERTGGNHERVVEEELPQEDLRARTVPVTLRPSNGMRVFLAEHSIRVSGKGVEPIEYEGRRYVFSHTTEIGAFGKAQVERAYVFHEAATA